MRTAIGSAAALLAIAAPAGATPLDPSFDGDGVVALPALLTAPQTPKPVAEIHDLAVLPDGRVVAVGSIASSATNTDFAVYRLNADGSPDTSFDGDGFTAVDFGTSFDTATGVALDGEKIVVAGEGTPSSPQQVAEAVRLDANGSPDLSFDGDGTQTLDIAARVSTRASTTCSCSRAGGSCWPAASS